MVMHQLPQELLSVIITEVAKWDDYASRTDLKNLRLSCRTLSYFVAPYLFHNLPLWLGMSSLRNLVEASEDPHMLGVISVDLFVFG